MGKMRAVQTVAHIHASVYHKVGMVFFLAGQMERWSVDSLNVGVATGIMLHRLLTSGSAAPAAQLSDQLPASASSLEAATAALMSQDSVVSPEGDEVVLAADISAPGDGLAAIALADEVHSQHSSPVIPASSGDPQSSDSPNLEKDR